MFKTYTVENFLLAGPMFMDDQNLDGSLRRNSVDTQFNAFQWMMIHSFDKGPWEYKFLGKANLRNPRTWHILVKLINGNPEAICSNMIIKESTINLFAGRAVILMWFLYHDILRYFTHNLLRYFALIIRYWKNVSHYNDFYERIAINRKTVFSHSPTVS